MIHKYGDKIYHLFHYNPQRHQSMLIIIPPSKISTEKIDATKELLLKETKNGNFDRFQNVIRYIIESHDYSGCLDFDELQSFHGTKKDIQYFRDILRSTKDGNTENIVSNINYIMEQFVKLQDGYDFIVCSLDGVFVNEKCNIPTSEALSSLYNEQTLKRFNDDQINIKQQQAQTGMRLLTLFNTKGIVTMPRAMIDDYSAHLPELLNLGFYEIAPPNLKSIKTKDIYKCLTINDQRSDQIKQQILSKYKTFFDGKTKLLLKVFNIDNDEVKDEQNDNMEYEQENENIKNQALLLSISGGYAQNIKSLMNDFMNDYYDIRKEHNEYLRNVKVTIGHKQMFDMIHQYRNYVIHQTGNDNKEEMV